MIDREELDYLDSLAETWYVPQEPKEKDEKKEKSAAEEENSGDLPF